MAVGARAGVCECACACVFAWTHWRAPTNTPNAPATMPSPQASLLRVPLPDVTRHYVLLAVARMLPCAEAHRALVAAGAEAAVQALLDGGPAAPELADEAAPPPTLVAGSFTRPAAWPDVQSTASKILVDIRKSPPAHAPQCCVCGKRAVDMPGGGPLKRCGGCRGPERWCSKECQRASWLAGHREACTQRKAAAVAPAST
jgi:hypothetical protein